MLFNVSTWNIVVWAYNHNNVWLINNKREIT